MEFSTGKWKAPLGLQGVPRWHLFPRFGCESECVNNTNPACPGSITSKLLMKALHFRPPGQPVPEPAPGPARAWGACTYPGQRWRFAARPGMRCVSGSYLRALRDGARPGACSNSRAAASASPPAALLSAGEFQVPGSPGLPLPFHALNPVAAWLGGIRRKPVLRTRGHRLAVLGEGLAPGLHQALPCFFLHKREQAGKTPEDAAL